MTAILDFSIEMVLIILYLQITLMLSTKFRVPFRWFKKGSCQFLAKECAQYWLTA